MAITLKVVPKNKNKVISITNILDTRKPEPNRVIDKELQSVLKPFHIIQYILFSSNYSITNNIIGSNSFIYDFFCISYFIVFQIFNFYSFISDLNYDLPSGFMDIYYKLGTICDFILFSIGIFVNSVLCVYQSQGSILLIVNIQRMFGSFRINFNELRYLIVFNWIYIIFAIIFSIISACTLHFCIIEGIGICDFVEFAISICFDVNVLYASVLLKLLNKIIEKWIGILNKCGDTLNEDYWKKMLNMYLDVYKVYGYLERTSRLKVNKYSFLYSSNIYTSINCNFLSSSYSRRGRQRCILWHVMPLYIVHPTVYHLCYKSHIVFFTIYIACVSLRVLVLILILLDDLSGKDVELILIIILTQAWNVKNMFILIWFTGTCEKFYAAVRDIQSICVKNINAKECPVIMISLSTVWKRRACKNIIRVQRTTFKKMSACGLFSVDATLPLQLSSFVTTYAVIGTGKKKQTKVIDPELNTLNEEISV
ncbi:hypothetical protein SFRURICE_017099 [Spodoptera frugiperda]|nr:hypothetical protein SFRURICE_017099 [Spodoptera frugiperda]